MPLHKTFLSLLVMVATCVPQVPATAAETSPRYNVLFIVLDDLNCHLGCYGAPVQSPNIDALAQRGRRFERAYCQFPLCCPSRSSFMTGLRPTTLCVHNNSTKFRELRPEVVTLSQCFRQHGYRAVRVGKIYHMGIPSGIGGPGLDDHVSWDAAFNVQGTGADVRVMKNNPANRALSEEQHPDGQVAREAVRQLESLRGQPFFLAVGFYRPHGPYVAPQAYHDQYDLSQIQVPPLSAEELAGIPRIAWHRRIPQAEGRPGLRREIADYHAAITFVDAQVGMVLDALDRLKLTASTIVVLLGDHGLMSGEHDLGGKEVLFEPAIRPPLIVAVPNRPAPGVASPRLVELVDLYPTLTELCGLSPPADLEGSSFVPLLDDPTRPWKRAAFTVVARVHGGAAQLAYSVRTERWHYNLWPDGSTELYDPTHDPGERHNVAADPASADTMQELRSILAAGWQASRPPQ